MLTPDDQSRIRQNSAELIAVPTAEKIVRVRPDLSDPPRGFDPDSGGSTTSTPSTKSSSEISAKLFWRPGAKLLATAFGQDIQCDVMAKIPWDSDVRPDDSFLIRGIEYRQVAPVREPPLRGYLMLALERKQDQPNA